MLNFPPGIQTPPTGITPTLLGQTGSIPATAVFMAPVSGVYLIGVVTHIVSTDNAGTLSVTITATGAANILAGPALATATDGAAFPRPVYLTVGQTVSASSTAVGMTGTTYEVYVSITRVL